MQLISNICIGLIFVAILSAPILFVIFLVRWCMKKPKKWFGIAALLCVASIIPLSLIGTFTDPSTYCDHEYSIVEEVAPTCTNSGKVVKECALCDRESTEHIDELGHDMKVVSRKEANQYMAGEIVYQCFRCGEKMTEVIEKLPKPDETKPPLETTESVKATAPQATEATVHTEPPATDEFECKTIEFDDLELSFGEYSFTEVKNKYSEYYGETVVKIPVTVTNLSNEAHSLNMFYFSTFGTSGAESESVWVYFDDDVANAKDLLPGKSYTKYFHILYDGDGVYTIVFDNLWFDEKIVEIDVVKKK